MIRGICFINSFESLLLFGLFVNFCLSSIYDYNARFRKRRLLVISFLLFPYHGIVVIYPNYIYLVSFTFVSACCYKNWAKLWKFCQIDYLKLLYSRNCTKNILNEFILISSPRYLQISVGSRLLDTVRKLVEHD